MRVTIEYVFSSLDNVIPTGIETATTSAIAPTVEKVIILRLFQKGTFFSSSIPNLFCIEENKSGQDI